MHWETITLPCINGSSGRLGRHASHLCFNFEALSHGRSVIGVITPWALILMCSSNLLGSWKKGIFLLHRGDHKSFDDRRRPSDPAIDFSHDGTSLGNTRELVI